MHLTLLAFFVLAIVKFQKSAESAVLDVFLPVLLLVPMGFTLGIAHLPPLSGVSLVTLPIATGALASRWSLWRYRRADLWVLIYVFASSYTDYLNLGLKSALDIMPGSICELLFAYVIGKLLIEQGGIREKFVRRLVTLAGAIGFISVVEFVLRQNLFFQAGRLVFLGAIYDYVQIRSGFRRVKGPFLGPEAAGIVFMMALILAFWLWFLSKSRGNAGEPKYLGLRGTVLWIAGIAGGLLMTISRGPWIGAALGTVIARIGLAKNTRLAAIFALLFCVAGGIFFKHRVDQIAHLDLQTASEQEATAYYRTQLYAVYEQVAEEGGLFGWSAPAYPREPGADSIDNHYLFLWVAQGKIGLWMFCLLVAEAVLGIAMAIRRSRQRLDTAFYYCLAGILAGLLFVLWTVFLAGQGLVLFFLFVGWSQSLRDQSSGAEGLAAPNVSRFSFRRTFA